MHLQQANSILKTFPWSTLDRKVNKCLMSFQKEQIIIPFTIMKNLFCYQGKKIQKSVLSIPKNKKLTHGLTFYEDIKLANVHNKSRNQDSSKVKDSRKNINSLNKNRNNLDMV